MGCPSWPARPGHIRPQLLPLAELLPGVRMLRTGPTGRGPWSVIGGPGAVYPGPWPVSCCLVAVARELLPGGRGPWAGRPGPWPVSWARELVGYPPGTRARPGPLSLKLD